MGVVYLAYDERLKVPVALKCLPRSLARDPRRLEQFHNEVRLARLISHPNVCRVHDIGDIDGQLFLTMEYINGQDLAARLRARGPLLEDEAIELLRGICAGLYAVHGQGILHRDLKPANVMLNPAGQPQLMDFGIADAATRPDDTERVTEGTIAYMAPELLRGGNATVQIHA
jgi:serine/threonine-protein kinase